MGRVDSMKPRSNGADHLGIAASLVHPASIDRLQSMLRYFLTRLAGAVSTLFISSPSAFFSFEPAPGGPFDQSRAARRKFWRTSRTLTAWISRF